MKCTCKNRPAGSWTSDIGPRWYHHEAGCYYGPLPKKNSLLKSARKGISWKPETRTNSVGHDL